MDELTLVRNMRSDAQIPDELLGRGRAALAAQIAAESMPRARRAHVSGRWTFGIAAAAALAVAAVVVSSIGWGGHPEPASAAPVLRQAAAAVQHESDPIVGPGQYLQITGNWYAGSAVGVPGADGGQMINAMGTYTRTLYVPADRSGTWVWQGSAFTPVHYLGDAKEKWKPGYNGTGWTETAPGGRFPDGTMPDFGFDPAALPGDPNAALAYLRKQFPGNPGDSPTDAMVWERVNDALISGLVPAATRATLYAALAQMPGVTIADKDATIHGKTGTAIAYAPPGADHEIQLVIDPTTGLLIGEQWVQIKAAASIPVGTITQSAEITTQVTDHAPAD